MQKLLILGGTNFIGRNLVEALLRDGGYDISLFNRQQSGGNLFPELGKIKGDRNTNDIEQIRAGAWDFVIDFSCYYPHQLQSSLAALKDMKELKRYIYISSCSVYDNEALQIMLRGEEAPLLSCTPEEAADDSPSTYGRRKAEGERILSESSLKHSILRPALVFGPYDPTDRLYYWLYQAQKHDPLVLPERGEGLFSLTYVKDLVEAVKACLGADGPSEVYNIISQAQASIAALLDLVETKKSTKARRLNATRELLDREKISPWIDMPLWLKGNHFTYSNRAMQQKLGLNPSPFDQALSETLNYYASQNWPEPHYGISEAQRQGLIDSLVG